MYQYYLTFTLNRGIINVAKITNVKIDTFKAKKGLLFMTYGYVRVSTKQQKEERQIDNIKAVYPDAVIVTDKFTGTKMDRPEWNKLDKKVTEGDTIVFDEVSRMSRDAEEGFEAYKDLYERGINLVFLKESTLNTEHYKQTAQIALTGSDVDCILKGINEYLMILAEKQIRAAFETAQHEVDFLHKRTSEGLAVAKLNGKRVGATKGDTYKVKKAAKTKAKIKKYSKDFEGTLNDIEVIKLTGVAKNTYYKYKKELAEELTK